MDAFIVIELNVVINNLFSFLQTGDGKLAKRFFFQVSEEIFHGSIVPAIAEAGHGRGDGIVMDQVRIAMGSILVSVVTMQDQSSADVFFLAGLFEGIEY